MIYARATGLTKNTQGKARRPYPNICREEMPTLEIRRHYCRLGAWHKGPHKSKKFKWSSGDRGVTPL